MIEKAMPVEGERWQFAPWANLAAARSSSPSCARRGFVTVVRVIRSSARSSTGGFEPGPARVVIRYDSTLFETERELELAAFWQAYVPAPDAPPAPAAEVDVVGPGRSRS